MHQALATRFGKNRKSFTSEMPLTDDQIRRVAPSIFADEKHSSRSARYSYIPTIDVLRGLQKEGFQPFMAGQSGTRIEGKEAHTKHMLRLRHADQIVGKEANEIILINSHDGTSSYQMLAGCFRFVCMNGMICGETTNDIRIKHSGDITNNVIEGAFRVLDDFDLVNEQRDGMKSLTLNRGEQNAFAHAALELKYDVTDLVPAPVTEEQILRARRTEDRTDDMWTTFNRVQENLIRGGLSSRSANGRRTSTREVTGIDQNTKLNRALWTLAESMRALKAA
jgi:hypothetical protein